MSFLYFAQILEAHTKVAEKTQIYVPYNILPLDPDSQNQAIMSYPEVSSTTWLYTSIFFFFLFPCCFVLAWVTQLLISWQIQSTVSALRNTRGLPWPKGHKKKEDEDILDWLRAMFGFQVTSIVFWCYCFIIIGNSCPAYKCAEGQCCKSKGAFDSIACKCALTTISKTRSATKGLLFLCLNYCLTNFELALYPVNTCVYCFYLVGWSCSDWSDEETFQELQEMVQVSGAKK